MHFDAIETEDGRRTSFENLFFRFSEPILYSNDDLALAWATLCGQKYDQVIFPFGISEHVHQTIRAFTRSELISEQLPNAPRALRTGNALSFSGGMDSMACLALLPRGTKLISIDFGGHFRREREFFKEFDPLIVTTNCRDTPLTDNSWAFMCIGALLSSSHFNAEYHTFGSIFEASNISTPPQPGTFSLLAASGYKGADLVKGLSEVATTKVVLQEFPPSLIQRAFDSLAGPNDNKRLRKASLIRAVSVGEQLPNPLPESTPLPDRKLTFGDYFADDFLSFYMAKFDPQFAETFEMPTEMIAIASDLDLDFMARLNTDFSEHLPAPLLPELYERCAHFDVLPYRSNDWAELQTIKNRLKSIHPKSV